MRTQSAEKKRQYLSFVFFALFVLLFDSFYAVITFQAMKETIKVPLIRPLKLFRSSLLCYLFLLFLFTNFIFRSILRHHSIFFSILGMFFIYILDISSLFFHKTMPNGLFQAIAFLSQDSPK